MKSGYLANLRLVISFVLITILIGLPTTVLAQGVLNLTVHYVQAIPHETRDAYKVSAFVSVLDEKGFPVQNLSLTNFSVFEDSQPVKIDGASVTTDVPISLIMVLDTSGSMYNIGLSKAKQAGANFIQKLSSSDRVAIMGFNEEVGKSSGFTGDLAAARGQLQALRSIPNSGTCLYDAAYAAVELANTLPPGRRAIILLTDGRDETATRSACSSYTVDDVIGQANGNSGNIPIYTIGLGTNIDENSLKRISGLTGGEYLPSPDNSQLGTLFDRLNQQIKNQYEITYESTGTPGPHKLAVEVAIGLEKDQSTRDFALPNLPARIRIISPAAGDTLGSQAEIRTQISGSLDEVEGVRFEVAGMQVSTVTSEPYSLTVDLKNYAAGNLEITAVALGEGSKELSRDGINVILASDLSPASPTNTPNSTITIIPTPNPWPPSGGTLGMVTVLSAAAMLVIVGVIFLVQRRKQPAPWPTEGYLPSPEATLDGFSLNNADALAWLTVLFSDDASLIGSKYPITKQITRLGRDAAKNDIAFEKDRPVSREHATISLGNDDKFMLAEVIREDPGQPAKTPTYGTFVNEIKVILPVSIFSGDQLRLGNRLKLLFNVSPKPEQNGDVTKEFIMPNDQPTNVFRELDEGRTKTFENPIVDGTKTIKSPIKDQEKTNVPLNNQDTIYPD